MKRVLMAAVLAIFLSPMLGCHAEGDVNDGARHKEEKKVTTVSPDGDTKTTKTEVKRY